MPTLSLTDPTNNTTADANLIASNNAAIKTLVNGGIDSSNIAAGGVQLANLATAIAQAIVPTGAVTPFAGAAAPTGWLLCDGSSQLRATYSALFAVIGTTYGSADGTHFTLPDLRDKDVVGVSGTKALASTGGAATAALGITNMPSHDHGGLVGTQTANHSHGLLLGGSVVASTQTLNQGAGTFLGSAGIASLNTPTQSGNESANHQHVISAQGSGTAFGVQDPYLALNHIIKT